MQCSDSFKATSKYVIESLYILSSHSSENLLPLSCGYSFFYPEDRQQDLPKCLY